MGINDKLPISEALADFSKVATGRRKTEMRRGEVQKMIFAYAREHGLKNDIRGDYKCDAALKKIMGKSSFKGVGDVARAMSKHFLT